ncbi:glycosyltransferase [Mycobacterium deserti]|uniref:4,4'-diaponeurosporenoate glycosyltransferase n=1 Tax=Mycobacterium deserti TaxID=2978347 RepID=A0ABT2M532_9MYCO|nr:glycosyltransferase [Mycobacterium deserti]MCT7657357.1 glycosyltransferase [Mycobacterium deserti]
MGAVGAGIHGPADNSDDFSRVVRCLRGLLFARRGDKLRRVISFVIPTLNERRTIETTLQSLSGYSGPHEIIVSDGNSKDGTVEVCRKYTDTVIVYTKPARQTIAMARNMGAAAATGDYLVFVDADVVIPDIDRFFDQAHQAFRAERGLVALTCRYQVSSEAARPVDRVFFTMLGLQFLLLNNILRIGAAGGEFQMIKADAFRKVDGFNESLAAAEDMDLFQRLSKIGRTRFVKNLTVYHTGRRAHAVGWPKLVWEWFSNTMSVWLFKRSASKEWKEIR